ncbi:MAG: DUF1036 domain-containing protein [Rhodopila sp.]
MITFFFLTAFSANAQASWQICNRTSEKMSVAIAYVDSAHGGFISQGWWQLRECGGCATVMSSGQTGDPNVFFRAEGSEGTEFSGGDHFCVSGSEPFKYRNAGTKDCQNRSLTVSFSHSPPPAVAADSTDIEATLSPA